MITDDRLREYVEYVTDGGDPCGPGHPLEDSEEDLWVSWRTDERGNTHLEIRATERREGYFVNGERTEPSWEGGVDGPDVAEWQGVREL
jgi:hypothetical protein